MFNLGFTEMLMVAILALIFIGPKKLPELAHSLGKMLNELKRATEELSGTVLDSKSKVTKFQQDLNKEIKAPPEKSQSKEDKSDT